MDDLISRQQAIAKLEEWVEENKGASLAGCLFHWHSFEGFLESLPSAQQTCGGYDIKKLVAFAIACQRAGVNEKDLKEFAQNCEFAWETMEKEFNKTLRETLGGIWNGV